MEKESEDQLMNRFASQSRRGGGESDQITTTAQAPRAAASFLLLHLHSSHLSSRDIKCCD
jgi:hypothetical protein